jgi:RND family efflux transporter MFP subunit
MKFAKLILIAALLAGLAAGVMAARDYLAGETTANIPTVAVARQTIERRVPAEGVLKAEKATPIMPPRGSRRLRIAWIKDDGSQVKEGEIVVRFDREEFERNLSNGKDAQKSAEFKLAIERAQNQGAQKTRDRSAELARIDLRVAQERKTTEDDEIFSRNELLTSNIDRQLSEARVDHAGAASKMDRSISHSKVKLLELEKQAAELEMTKAQDGLSRMEVKAPHDGVFVYENDRIEVGATVYRGQTLGKLPLTATMEAEVFVLEADVKGLVEGTEAIFFIEAQPGKQYQAKIKTIDTLAKPRHRDVPIQYFTITLELAETDTAVMKPGQRVRADLKLPALDGLVVPRQCVFEVDGDMVVFRQQEGSFDTVKVKLGAGTPGLVVIEEGLSDGDRIATQDPFGRASETEADPADSAEAPTEGAS